MAMENHVHSFKRTHPLKGGQVDPEGITYIGDGSWSVILSECKPTLIEELFVKKGLEFHVWVLTIDIPNSKMDVIAVKPSGEILDSFTL